MLNTEAFRAYPRSKARIVLIKGLARRMIANCWLRHSQAQAFIRTEAHYSKFRVSKLIRRMNSTISIA